MRTIGVITGARSDYGLLVPLLRKIEAHPGLELRLYVTGMHFSPEFGNSIDDIVADGFAIAEQIPMLVASDSPQAVAKSMGLAVLGFAQAYARTPCDILVGLGDRYELLSAVEASLPFHIPFAHISGGEITEGAMDELIRHAISKMSRLHFVAAEPFARRLIQMGEEPWRVHVTGEPGLDNLHELEEISVPELETLLGMPLSPAPILVTYHPATMEYEETAHHVRELLAALAQFGRPVVFTYPNAETGSQVVIDALREHVRTHPSSRLARNLGRRAYCSLMKRAPLMAGNSSSGIAEAASFELPVVNVGNRQKGRLCGKNVIHAPDDRSAILSALQAASTAAFGEGLRGMQNPYGDGRAAERIVELLVDTPLDRRLRVKKFHDAS